MIVVFLAILFVILFYFFFTHQQKSKEEKATASIPDNERYKTEIYDFTYQYDTPMIKHKPGCGCRLCYVAPKDFRDLKEYNWWDFHDGSGQRVYANGTLPLFGLWTNKYELRAPHCLKAKFDWRFNSPCTDPHKVIDGTAIHPDYPFPAECNKLGRCRIRGPLEDNIKNI